MLFSNTSRLDAYTSSSRLRSRNNTSTFVDSSNLQISGILSSSPPGLFPPSPDPGGNQKRGSIEGNIDAMMMQRNGGSARVDPRNPSSPAPPAPAVAPPTPSPINAKKEKKKTVADRLNAAGWDGSFSKVPPHPPTAPSPDPDPDFVPTRSNPHPKTPKIGHLSGLLGDDDDLDDGHGPGADSSIIKLCVYLAPDTTPLSFTIAEDATVDLAITTVLKEYVLAADDYPGVKVHGHAPQCYELRLHEGDGEPDEDFPALDRNQNIKNFGDGGDYEYCLCQIPNVPVPTVSISNMNAGENGPSRVRMMSRASGLSSKAHVKVHLHPGAYKIIHVPDEGTVRVLCAKVVSQYLNNMKTSLATETFEFHVNDVDKKRLGLMSNTLSGEVVLKKLEVEEIFLQKKKFADDPVIVNKKAAAVQTNVSGKPDIEQYMQDLDDMTAGRYKEFSIVKKNKFGRHQKRNIGIDNIKIYNMKRGAAGLTGRVFTAFRLISTVRSIEVLEREQGFFERFGETEEEDYKTLKIDFQDGDEEKAVSWEITAKDKYECAEIVAKIKYLGKRGNKQDMLAELKLKRA